MFWKDNISIFGAFILTIFDNVSRRSSRTIFSIAPYKLVFVGYFVLNK